MDTFKINTLIKLSDILFKKYIKTGNDTYFNQHRHVETMIDNLLFKEVA